MSRIKKDFKNTLPPSGDGFKTCPDCGGDRCHVRFGPIPTKTFDYKDGYVTYHRYTCLDCDFFEEGHAKERKEYFRRLNPARSRYD